MPDGQFCAACGRELHNPRPAPTVDEEAIAIVPTPAPQIGPSRAPSQPSEEAANEEYLRSGDVLGALGPTFQLRGGGPDVIVTRSAQGAAGSSVWLQNPHAAPLTVQVLVHKPDDASNAEKVAVVLSPLEIGRVDLPMRRTQFDLVVKVTSAHSSEPRKRAAGSPGQLDGKQTALGLLQGAAGLALFGVGRFSSAKRGGPAANPLELKFTVEGSVRFGAEVTYERIWALRDAPPPSLPAVTHRSTQVWEMTPIGWAVVTGCLAAGYIIIETLTGPSAKAAPTGLSIGLVVAIAIAVLAKYRRISPVARVPSSILFG